MMIGAQARVCCCKSMLAMPIFWMEDVTYALLVSVWNCCLLGSVCTCESVASSRWLAGEWMLLGWRWMSPEMFTTKECNALFSNWTWSWIWWEQVCSRRYDYSWNSVVGGLRRLLGRKLETKKVQREQTRLLGLGNFRQPRKTKRASLPDLGD